MNERIKELAEQAGMTDDKFGMFFAKDKHDEDGVDLAKFAELIAEECAGIAYRSSDSGDIAAMSILYEFNIDNARFQK
jgi:hypothetical protein